MLPLSQLHRSVLICWLLGHTSPILVDGDGGRLDGLPLYLARVGNLFDG